jgi:hypothetical protein
MRVQRTLIKALAILATPIVEEATLRIHRRRRVDARAAGIDGINELFYRIFGPNLKPGAEAAAASPHSGDESQPLVLADEPSPLVPRPSAEVVEFHRRSAS